MAKIKIEKDNVILSIEQEELAQYKARGFTKLGATKEVAPKDLEKKITKIAKSNEDLTAKIETAEKERVELTKVKEDLEKQKVELIEANKALTAKVAELEKKLK